MKKILPITLIIVTIVIIIFAFGLKIDFEKVPNENDRTVSVKSTVTESYFIQTNASIRIESNITFDVTSEETKRIMHSGGVGKSLIDDRLK